MSKKIICLVLCLLMAMQLFGCGKAEPVETEAPTTEAPTTEPTTEPTAEPTTEPTTEPTEPPLVLHSGLREDGSFNEGTWFIGDSMTCILVTDYLIPNNLIGDASYTGKYGAQITAFFGDVIMDETRSTGICAYRPEHYGMQYDEVAVALGEQATAIYLMMGTNYTWNAYADAYIELIDFLLETCPNATVYMQTIPYGAEGFVWYKTVNTWINEAYAHYQEIEEERVQLIDTYTAIGINHQQGYIHLNYKGNENWYNAIVAYAEEHGIGE